MSQRLAAVGLVVVLLASIPVQAQKATEIFIPIGKSPGASGKYSVIGTIKSLDVASGTLTIVVEDREHTARVTEETTIWLDRHEMKKPNVAGSDADCQKGRLCEVKYVYEGGTRTERAEWIKIRVGEPV